MNHYVYCYSTKILRRQLKENETIKLGYGYRYIINYIDILEEWSGKLFYYVLYDSERDRKDASIFRKKILNSSLLYFIVIETDNNVYDHYPYK